MALVPFPGSPQPGGYGLAPEEDDEPFDELIIALFLSGARAQTLPVRIWNSLHLEIEPVIAAVSAFLIAVTGVVLLVDGAVRRLRAHSIAGGAV